MCLFCKGEKEELGVGGVGRGRRGDSLGGEGTEWGTVKGALLQSSSISQLWIHVWITDVAWGAWWTNAGSEAMRGVLITRFELTCNPKPLRALCLLLLTPTLVGTSRGVCLGFSWSCSGRSWQRACFLSSAFCVCQFQTWQIRFSQLLQKSAPNGHRRSVERFHESLPRRNLY